MKKQAMMASLLSLALLVSPIGSLGAMSRVNAEEDPGVVINSVSDNASVLGSTEEKIQLDTPTNLRWGSERLSSPYSKYLMYWEGVNESTDNNGFTSWDIQVYKDDKPFRTLPGAYHTRVTEHEANNLSPDIGDSGSYKFRVRALAQYGDETYQDSEWSEWSESISYVRPERELGTTSGYWDTEQAGVCHIIPLDDPQYAGNHWVTFYKQNKAGTWERLYAIRALRNADKTTYDLDFSYDISRYGEGKYCFTVQVDSRDVDTIFNGKEGPKSGILDTTVNADKLGGILNGAADRDAAGTVELLKGSADISAIQQAMQTSDSFREQIKELEDRYAKEQGITVNAPAVSEAAGEYVDPGKVSVVGAAFNAAQGSEVSLRMDATLLENRIPSYSGYRKTVQLDISLVSAGSELHELSMPVTVTMSVPQGLDVSQLAILHHHADGTVEWTAFHVNGDGTITFTVSSFSTFVFVDESSAEVPGDKPSTEVPGDKPSSNPAPAQNGGNNSSKAWADSLGVLADRIASAVPGDTVKVTGDQNISTLSNTIMQLLVKRGDVALEMEYVYEGEEYHVIIPAGGAVDDDIAWYGPLYLSAYFSAASAGLESGSVYTVQRGDTLGGIARRHHTTVARLAAANPQIRNVNYIVTGQIINID